MSAHEQEDAQAILKKTDDLLAKKRKEALKKQDKDSDSKKTTSKSHDSVVEDDSDHEEEDEHKKNLSVDELAKAEDERRRAVEFERKTAFEVIKVKDKHEKPSASDSTPTSPKSPTSSSTGSTPATSPPTSPRSARKSAEVSGVGDDDDDDENHDEDVSVGGERGSGLISLGGVGGGGGSMIDRAKSGSVISDASDDNKGGHDRAPSRVVWNLNALNDGDGINYRTAPLVQPLIKGIEFWMYDNDPKTHKSSRTEVVVTYDPSWGGRLGAIYWHAKGSRSKDDANSMAIHKMHDVVKGLKPKIFDTSGVGKEIKVEDKMCCSLIGEPVDSGSANAKTIVKTLNLEAHDVPSASKFVEGLHYILESCGYRLCVSDHKERMSVVKNHHIALPYKEGERVKLGFLYKMNLIKKWNERFVQVNGDDLEYYTFDITARIPFKLKGRVCLIQATVSEIDADLCSRDHVFAIRPTATSSATSSPVMPTRRRSDSGEYSTQPTPPAGGGNSLNATNLAKQHTLKDALSLNLNANNAGGMNTGGGGGGDKERTTGANASGGTTSGVGVTLWQAANDLDREGWKEFLETRIAEIQREDSSPSAEVFTLKTLPPAGGGKEGFLDKLGGRLKPRWQVRFFQQTPRALKYYSVHVNTADRLDSHYKQAGIIPIEGAQISIPDVSTYVGRQHVFVIKPRGSTKSFVLQARNDAVRHEWMEALEKQAKGEILKFDSNYAKVGFMQKMGNRRNKAFKERYWILTHDRLRYFRKAADLKPAGTIPLFAGAQLQRELQFTYNVPNCFSIQPPHSKRKYILWCSTSQLRDEWMSAIRTIIENNETQRQDQK